MKRVCWLVLIAIVGLSVSSAAAQTRRPNPNAKKYARFEFTPIAGYNWGGSYPLDAGTGHPAGDLRIDDSFAYGAVLSFLAARGSAVELTYLRQDTKLRFDPNGAAGSGPTSANFAVNYIHLGGRQEFGHSPKIRPFIDGSFGATVFDVKENGIGTSTNFSLMIGGGFQSMFGQAQRFGLRAHVKGWFSFVPTNDYDYWCGFYGCGSVQNSETVSQGEVSGGLVIKF